MTPEVIWPFDVGYGWLDNFGDQLKPKIIRVRSVEPKSLRGKVRLFSKYMALLHIALLDGRAFVAGTPVAYIGGKWARAGGEQEWVYTNERRDQYVKDHSPHLTDFDKTVRFATSVALRRRYYWGVEIGNEGYPSFIFTVNSAGLGQLFDDREKADLSNRREALKSWISGHWRGLQEPNEDIETYVRKHLRGTLQFEWRGFDVKVHVPSLDLETRDRYREERELMRLNGADRRPRLTA